MSWLTFNEALVICNKLSLVSSMWKFHFYKTFLNGITRTTIIDLLKAKDLEVIERDIKLEELKNVTECFLTGTAAEVTPVGKIAEFEFKPGNLCKEILGSYSELVRA